MADTSPPPAFTLPEALLSQGWSLRREGDADLPVLMQLYASTRADEMKRVPWDEDEKRAFVIQQFAAQRSHYYNYFADGDFLVVERHGKPVGRLYIQEVITRVHLHDIVLMPENRGAGVGSAIVSALQDFAATRGKGVDLFVERHNPAFNLYRRFGFEEVGEGDVYVEMDWTPDGVS